MSNSNLVPKSTVDKNGKQTTVHVNPNKGAANNGKAARATIPPVAAPSISDGTTAALAEVTDYILNHSFELTTVDGRDNIAHADESMQAFLVGDQDTIDANMRFGYETSEQRRENAIYEIKSILSRHATLEWDDLSEDEQEELINNIESMDTSDIVAELVANTPPQLVKLDFDDAYNAVAEYALDENGNTDWDKHNFIMYGSNDNYDERVAFLSSYLEGKGFKTHTTEGQEAIHEIIGNGNYDWHSSLKIGLTFRTPLQDVNVGDIIGGEEKDERALTFKEPVNVGMIDRENGSGWISEFEPSAGGARFVVDKHNPVSLDSVGGWGWDKITGGTWGMETAVESEWTY